MTGGEEIAKAFLIKLIKGEIADYRNEDFRKNALTTDVGEYKIDTCNTTDMGRETAIKKVTGDDCWVIVERYDNEAQMKKGHKKWCKYCEGNPKTAFSIDWGEYEEL